MNYKADFLERGINNILEIAIVFEGKEVRVIRK